jgi:DNA-binding CsgD family transcriptional regulator
VPSPPWRAPRVTAGYGARAPIELRAVGGHARERTVKARDSHTPQEALIARLAGEGGSNPEIAAQLFISRATVACRLRKVLHQARRQLAQPACSRASRASHARQAQHCHSLRRGDSRADPRRGGSPGVASIKTLSTIGY